MATAAGGHETKNGYGQSISMPPAPKRDSRGGLVFEDFPLFRPTLTPEQVIRMGSFGGCYFHPRGGKPGILGRTVDVTHKEFPSTWFDGLRMEEYAGRRYRTAEINKYGVKAGQDQAEWERKGWIIPQDPRGWFQWYCRFWMGRRTDDDARQVSRWVGVAGKKGRWKTVRAATESCLQRVAFSRGTSDK